MVYLPTQSRHGVPERPQGWLGMGHYCGMFSSSSRPPKQGTHVQFRNSSSLDPPKKNIPGSGLCSSLIMYISNVLRGSRRNSLWHIVYRASRHLGSIPFMLSPSGVMWTFCREHRTPFPSMPVYFWGDTDGSKYRSAYFEAMASGGRGRHTLHQEWEEGTSSLLYTFGQQY